jgi:hypothetical protein
MPILTKTITWRRPRPPNETRGANDLTPEEQDHVRAALRVLRARFGSWPNLAKAMRAGRGHLQKIVGGSGTPSAGLALRAARAAGVPMEDVLSGAWPKPGACPMCGRVT